MTVSLPGLSLHKISPPWEASFMFGKDAMAYEPKYSVKDWDNFQHFTNRRPPWIKLYKYLLDDKEWHDLDSKDAKILTMLWLLASEDKSMTGQLPSVETMAFRLRTTETAIVNALGRLKHWITCDGINVVSNGHQNGIPETETETDKRQRQKVPFREFWELYPNKKGKAEAEATWKRMSADEQHLAIESLPRLEASDSWTKDNGDYIPMGSTFLNKKRWLDEETVTKAGALDEAQREERKRIYDSI